MGTRLSRSRFRLGCLIAVIVFCLCLGNEAFSKDTDPHMTGLPELTKEELEWQNKHMKRVRKVKLNKLGLERINNWRKKKGQKQLTEDEAGIVPKGNEIDGVIGEPTGAEPSEAPSPSDSPPGDLPPDVDNSTLIYFPPIRSQGSLPSCGCFLVHSRKILICFPVILSCSFNPLSADISTSCLIQSSTGIYSTASSLLVVLRCWLFL